MVIHIINIINKAILQQMYTLFAICNSFCFMLYSVCKDYKPVRKEMIISMGFTITAESKVEFTQISNLFIRTYMPKANGNFVKTYLYLLMVHQHPADFGDISVGRLADLMECTENDILRAFRYWQKEGLLVLQENETGITEIILRDIHSFPATTEESSSIAAEAPSIATFSTVSSIGETAATAVPEEIPVPERRTYTPLQAEALSKDVEINKTISRVEQMLGAPVSLAHLQLILYFMCDIGFSSELLVTLYEVAVRKGKKKPNYIEAIGIDWAKKGITTPEQAREEADNFSGRYSLVAKALGINRSLAPSEREIIDGWETYHFADSIIKEACKRTVLQTGDTSLHYVSGILKSWHEKNVISLQDIKKCDESFNRQKRTSHAGKKNTATKNQFQNFPQRIYTQSEYNSLEKQLLRGQKMEG